MHRSSVHRNPSRMDMMLLAVGIFLAATAILHFTTIAVVIWRIRRSRTSSPVMNVGISIVRPVCGLENFSEETLSSVFRLAYPRYEVLFCAASASDPVVPLVRQLIEQHRDVPAQLLIGNDRVSDNPKLNNVVKGWEAASHAWIVMADSNVLMPPDYLHRLLGTWRADTGLVSSPAIGCWPDGVWAELECAFLNTYQARWQCFIDSVGIGFAQGKSMLYRRELLESAGGIRALSAELAEDAASTKIVRRQGLRVRVVDRPFPQPLGRRGAAEVWGRQVRWARLRRDTFILYYLPELFAGAVLPLAACALLAWSYDWPLAGTLAAFAALWYGAEAALAAAAGWHLSWRSPAIWLLRDLLTPVLWVASFAGNGFVWRDNAMRVADRGSAA
jgi:ceramide glucosyltransferase